MLWFVMLVPVLVLHEYAHAWMATQLGDPLPWQQGRLSLNPLRHVDPIGGLLVPAVVLVVSLGHFVAGWAKPVQFQPEMFADWRRGTAMVAGAGPLANLVSGAIAALALRLLPDMGFVSEGLAYFSAFSLCIAAVNLLPIPPLDGSYIAAYLLRDDVGDWYLRNGIWLGAALVVGAIVLGLLGIDLLNGYMNVTGLALLRGIAGV